VYFVPGNCIFISLFIKWSA